MKKRLILALCLLMLEIQTTEASKNFHPYFSVSAASSKQNNIGFTTEYLANKISHQEMRRPSTAKIKSFYGSPQPTYMDTNYDSRISKQSLIRLLAWGIKQKLCQMLPVNNPACKWSSVGFLLRRFFMPTVDKFLGAYNKSLDWLDHISATNTDRSPVKYHTFFIKVRDENAEDNERNLSQDNGNEMTETVIRKMKYSKSNKKRKLVNNKLRELIEKKKDRLDIQARNNIKVPKYSKNPFVYDREMTLRKINKRWLFTQWPSHREETPKTKQQVPVTARNGRIDSKYYYVGIG